MGLRRRKELPTKKMVIDLTEHEPMSMLNMDLPEKLKIFEQTHPDQAREIREKIQHGLLDETYAHLEIDVTSVEERTAVLTKSLADFATRNGLE